MLTTSYLNVPEGFAAKLAQMSAHIFEDSSHMFTHYSLRVPPPPLRDSLVLTYTDVVPL